MKERNEVNEKNEINDRLIKDRIIRDIRTVFEKEDHYCKLKRVSNFCNNNYIEYKSNGEKNKNLSLDEYLDKTESGKSHGLHGNVGYVGASVAWVCGCMVCGGQIFRWVLWVKIFFTWFNILGGS